MAVAEYLPQIGRAEVFIAPFNVDTLPWYFDRRYEELPPDDLQEVHLPSLRPAFQELSRFSAQVTAEKEMAGKKPVEVGMSFGMNPHTGLIVPGRFLEGGEDDVDSDIGMWPVEGFAPFATLHTHVAPNGKRIVSMPSYKDPLPGVTEEAYGRLSLANFVFTQEEEGPVIYLSMPTKNTPALSAADRELHRVKWKARSDRQKALSAAVDIAHDNAQRRWEDRMGIGMQIIPILRAKKENGSLTAEDHIIWQAERGKLAELNNQGGHLDQDPEVVEAQRCLDVYEYTTPEAVRRGAHGELKVPLFVAHGWDMRFKRVDLDRTQLAA